MKFLYLISTLYILAILIVTIRHRKFMKKTDRISAIFIIIGAVLSILLALISKELLIELFIQSILLMSLFFSIEHTYMQYNAKTGVYPREMFIETLEQALESKRQVTVLSLKVKGLSYYRMFRKKTEADQIIKEITDYIKTQTAIEQVFNFSGNGLTAILPYHCIDSKETIIKNANKKYNNWKFKNRIKFRVLSFNLPDDADTLEDALILLEKTQYKGTDFFIDKGQIEESKRNIKIAHALKNGLKKNRFRIVLQPIVNKDDVTVSSEVLVRFKDPELGELSPSEFIPIAERTGLIWNIGLFTMREAAKVLSSKECRMSTIEYLEVNLSVAQCLHGGCAEAFMGILNNYNVTPDKINLEITESAFIEDFEMFYEECNKLREAGFKFSVDDYGSGFSNYRYIVAVNPEIVKLDRDVLLEAKETETGEIFYQSTVNTIKNLGYNVVSEGVETEEERDFVRYCGVDYIQGFLYRKPLSVDKYMDYLKNICMKEEYQEKAHVYDEKAGKVRVMEKSVLPSLQMAR